MPRGRKKQQQRSRRSINMEKAASNLSLEGIKRSIELEMEKMCPSIEEELRNIPESEVKDKEKWIEDFKPIYEKALSNPNEKNKLLITKYVRAVYAYGDLKMRYDRNKKIEHLFSQMQHRYS